MPSRPSIVLADADLDWRDHERMQFVLSNLIDAAAPSNNPLLNPGAWKAAIDTGGLSAVRGLRSALSDLAAMITRPVGKINCRSNASARKGLSAARMAIPTG